ncbi:unnamed protein product [Prunus brigantina]
MRLNPSKCAVGVASGKFLGFMISQRGIEANPEKIRALIDMRLAYTLVLSAQRLRPYFQAHSINVLTNQPVRQVLQKQETSGRLIKWAIELGEFDISYHPRPSKKGQAVADFIFEFTTPNNADPPTASTGPPLPSTDIPSASPEPSSAETTFDNNSPH